MPDSQYIQRDEDGEVTRVITYSAGYIYKPDCNCPNCNYYGENLYSYKSSCTCSRCTGVRRQDETLGKVIVGGAIAVGLLALLGSSRK